ASPKADAPPQERLLHEKPPGGNNEQLVDGLHATETDELEIPPRPPGPAAPPPCVLIAYAISSLFRTGAAANMTTTARLSPNTNNVMLF
ncbi:MAG TPA: hypothetical protein VFI70_13470, partial [Nitrososphaeraceae archaeon]|nr:hypothetical protein [Nitrososphaeraceae archaeon]